MKNGMIEAELSLGLEVELGLLEDCFNNGIVHLLSCSSNGICVSMTMFIFGHALATEFQRTALRWSSEISSITLSVAGAQRFFVR